MGQMSAVIQVHAHDRITRFQYGKLHCHIRLCSGMGLYIGIITAEQLLGTLDCQIFDDIHALTSAVISLAGITFRIFIGQGTAHSRHDCLAYPVFGSDQFNMTVLTILLVDNGLCHLGINFFYFIQ